ncbi:aspartate carbamoyltransferase [Candidatus Falkowbacteria bacterium RIFCSPLOWO2_12_FULL_45_13]|uniref:Aspartate carbamoyltransferase n=2 Tax=Candidatus Falkowiibacteriota TaxID=1752728 RepID=A0A1F5SCV9_9BACT|nr:MAG: aspartate carbamoyltransferase [Candidatus Falkowbacteria bacterium RIFCSPLOWO2_02_FULL_45_21]OGF32067.1 MAG: aspartate carbamoyltransferase [Candidatus Falkowbacteria bacterium RIFCSPLOWO2_12_FULL_45_13]
MKKLKSVIRAQQFDETTIKEVFAIADTMRAGHFDSEALRGKIMVALFYEPSTRTRLSFETAMLRLGGRVIGTENAREFSSAAKGEKLEDTIKVISGYGPDVIVLRYHEEGGAERAQHSSPVPIINAGDGTGQHPTQALLDLFTIRQEFGRIDNLDIALVGDLSNGRTVRSLCYFLAKHYPNNRVHLVSPEQTKMRDDVKAYLDKYDVRYSEANELDSVLPVADVIYQTRVQKERFKDNPTLYQDVVRASEKLIITPSALKQMKQQAIIMHPLPRVKEIDHAVDDDPRAAYFRQAQNGLYVRMALLKMVINGYQNGSTTARLVTTKTKTARASGHRIAAVENVH